MGKIRIVGRRMQDGRCAYCRAPAAAEESQRCVACGAETHAACLAELGGCPTFGCAQVSPHAAEARRGRRGRRGAAAAEPNRERRRDRPRRTATNEERIRAGRLTRRPPGTLARIGPYSRMAVKAALAAVIALAVMALFVWGLMNPGEVYAMGPLGALAVAVMLGGFAFLCMDWLARLPSLWARVGALLDDGQVQPVRVTVYRAYAGKHKNTYVSLDSAAPGGWSREGIEVGLFAPWWLWACNGRRAFVHGAESDGPYVLEFESGLLAMLETD